MASNDWIHKMLEDSTPKVKDEIRSSLSKHEAGKFLTRQGMIDMYKATKNEPVNLRYPGLLDIIFSLSHSSAHAIFYDEVSGYLYGVGLTPHYGGSFQGPGFVGFRLEVRWPELEELNIDAMMAGLHRTALQAFSNSIDPTVADVAETFNVEIAKTGKNDQLCDDGHRARVGWISYKLAKPYKELAQHAATSHHNAIAHFAEVDNQDKD